MVITTMSRAIVTGAVALRDVILVYVVSRFSVERDVVLEGTVLGRGAKN